MEMNDNPAVSTDLSVIIEREVWECPSVSRIPMAEAEGQFTQNTDGTFGS